MKNTISRYLRVSVFAMAALLGGVTISAQNSFGAPGSGGGPGGVGGAQSAPAPGAGGSFRPNAPVGPANGLGWNPGPGVPGPGPGWNNGWGPGWNNWNTSPSIVVNVTPNPNQGTEKVIACGYDAQGIWRVIPMVVSYTYNGAQYNVTVLSAYNPWSDMWDTGIDQQAFNTYYYLRGVYYNFYAPLATGTYYFNL